MGRRRREGLIGFGRLADPRGLQGEGQNRKMKENYVKHTKLVDNANNRP